MVESSSLWASRSLTIENYGGVAANATMTRGCAGEVTVTFACDLPQGVFDAFFLRYDPSRQCVDLIAHLDLGEPYSLEASTSIPANLCDEFAEAADDFAPDPVRLFSLMVEVENGLGV